MAHKKNNYKTLDKLWDLDDKQLKTPKHDKMVLWLLKQDNLNKIGLVKEAHKELTKDIKCYVEVKKPGESYLSFSGKYYYKIEDPNFIKNLPLNIDIKSEVPLKAKNGYLGGYVDILIRISLKLKGMVDEVIPGYRDYLNTLTSEDGSTIKTDGAYEITGAGNSYRRFYIEVKPKIESFGEVLRQINTYKSFIGGRMFKYNMARYYLFTLDTQFNEEFESQGITVINPPEEL